MRIWLFALLALNIVSAVLFVADKQFAIKNHRRISEKTLLMSAFCFGAGGALLGMLAVRHKTKKLKFCILVPLLFVCQAVFLGWALL